ncbi:MAG: single-stranded-DNA-specific exonuclease RecJ [Bacillota bacterium]
MSGETWRVAPEEPFLQALFKRELGISDITARLLVNRGVWSLREAAEFLTGEVAALPSPLFLKDIDKAVARIVQAVERHERILVYGDYDADGVTATALLFLTLEKLGVRPACHLPSREEGYGLKSAMLRQAREEGVGLLITVDCGINACEEAALCREFGIDLIVTDHHQPGPQLPEAVAVVNPKQADCPYPYKDLAGVGVAYKLATALLAGTGSDVTDLLDLVAIGTVADVVPLTGENRVLVRAGLERINVAPRPGVGALLQSAGAERTVTGRSISMFLAPRINAAGRVGNPHAALELLLSGEDDAAEKAAQLVSLNQERQRLEALMLAEALAMLDGQPAELEKKVIVMAGEGWLPGLTGLVANRLLDRYKRPVFVVALNGEKGRGSGRGTPGFDVYKALRHAAPFLLEYGGHTGAGGFSIDRDAVMGLKGALEDYALRDEPPEPTSFEFDADVGLADISPELVTELDLLEPHGCGNPAPRLVSYGLEVEDARPVGQNGNHLKLRLRQGGFRIDAIGFGLAGDGPPPRVLDVAFRPIINEMTGRVELKIDDFRVPVRDRSAGMERAGSWKRLLKKNLFYINQLTDLYLPEEITIKQKDKPAQGSAREMLVDLREHPDRWAVLRRIILKKSAAVVVSTPAVAFEVASRVRLAFPEKAHRVAVFHSGVLEERRTLGELAAAGEVDVLVTTPALAGRFAEEKDVVVFDLMHTWQQWEWLGSCGGRSLTLLYGRRDREAARQRLYALAPPRRVLLGFYQYLQRHAGHKRTTVLLPEAIGVLRSCGVPGAGRKAVENVLRVLSELEILEYTPVAGGFNVRVQAAKEKRFLPSAPTFRQQYAFKREMLSCQQHFLTTPAEVLKDYFRCGIISRGGTDGTL